MKSTSDRLEALRKSQVRGPAGHHAHGVRQRPPVSGLRQLRLGQLKTVDAEKQGPCSETCDHLRSLEFCVTIIV
jgi:hypothetical protein